MAAPLEGLCGRKAASRRAACCPNASSAPTHHTSPRGATRACPTACAAECGQREPPARDLRTVIRAAPPDREPLTAVLARSSRPHSVCRPGGETRFATVARLDVRWIACLLLALLGLGYVACQLPSRATVPDRRAEDPWRRTAEGWELRTCWARAAPSPHHPLHPLVVAALQVLLSLFALVAFPVRRLPLFQDPKPSCHAPRSAASRSGSLRLVRRGTATGNGPAHAGGSLGPDNAVRCDGLS